MLLEVLGAGGVGSVNRGGDLPAVREVCGGVVEGVSIAR